MKSTEQSHTLRTGIYCTPGMKSIIPPFLGPKPTTYHDFSNPTSRKSLHVTTNQTQSSKEEGTKSPHSIPFHSIPSKHTSDDGNTKPLRLHSPTNSSIEQAGPSMALSPPTSAELTDVASAVPAVEVTLAVIRVPGALLLATVCRFRRNSDVEAAVYAFRYRGFERHTPVSDALPAMSDLFPPNALVRESKIQRSF